MEERKKLVVCGGGNSSHILIPFLRDSVFDVYVYTSRPSQWSNRIDLEWQDANGKLLDTSYGEIKLASNDPKELFHDADYVVFCMPVHKYRVALHEIAPYLNREKDVILCTLYSQGGWNWMVDEIKKEQGLNNIVTFAFGLIPWICRIKEYGHTGVVYGVSKIANFAAVSPSSYFPQITKELIEPITKNKIVNERVEQSSNFISLTMSADNQIIHTSRCLGLYKVYGKEWDKKEDVPWFYKDWDDLSADILKSVDAEYTLIRNAFKKNFPEKDFFYMRDYMELEQFGYDSEITDIKASFTDFGTLDAIATPVAQNENGKWQIDRTHRFFLDDIFYGNCIAKWMAEQFGIETPTIDEVLRWAQLMRGEQIIDENNHLIVDSPDLTIPMKTGIPTVYGFKSINDCVD